MSEHRSAVKLFLFCVVTVTVTVLLASVLGNFRFESTNGYRAIATNASNLKSGDDVKMQGVPVGKVRSVELLDTNEISISFTVATRIALSSTSTGAVRYKNLIGDRYLEVSTPPGGTPLPEGGTIPRSQMQAALDIDKVVNGFRPLLEGLDPNEMNRFTSSVIDIFAGQTSRIGDLIAQIGELANTVAGRDEAIDRVIANLNTVVTVADNRSRELDQSIDQLQQIVSALNADRTTITGALTSLEGASRTVAGLLTETRPSIAADVRGLRDLAHDLNINTETLQTLLGGLPKTYQKIARAGGYGNFINFFLCGVAIRYPGPQESSVTPMFTVPAERCQG